MALFVPYDGAKSYTNTGTSTTPQVCSINGSILSQEPPASPHPIRGMCIVALCSAANWASNPRHDFTASYLMGGTPSLPRLILCCAIIFAIHIFGSTSTNCTLPRAKSFDSRFANHWRYCRSGSRQRFVMAKTNPLPQPPMSLQICR